MSGQDPSKSRLYTFKASNGAEVRNAAARQNRGYTVRRERLVHWQDPGATQASVEGTSRSPDDRPYTPSGTRTPIISSAPATMTSSYRIRTGETAPSIERPASGFEGAMSYARQPHSAAAGNTGDRQRPPALNLPSGVPSHSNYQVSGNYSQAWVEGNYTSAVDLSNTEISPYSSSSSHSQPPSYPSSADFFDAQAWAMQQGSDYTGTDAPAPCLSHGGAELTLATCQYCGFDYILDAGGEVLGTIRKRFGAQHLRSHMSAQQTQMPAQFYSSPGTSQTGFTAIDQQRSI